MGTNRNESEEEIGSLIRRKRQERSISQHSLAETIGCTIKTISRWERGAHEPEGRFHDKLKDELKIDDTSFDAALKRSKTSYLPMAAYSLAELTRKGADIDFVLSKADRISDIWEQPEPNTNPGDLNYMGESDTWHEISLKSPHTHFYLMKNGNTVCAFWSFVSIRPDTYERIRQGERVNEYITANDILTPIIDERIHVYFVDLFHNPDFVDDWSLVKHLEQSLASIIVKWAENDIFIERIVAHLSTPLIPGLATRYGFEKITDHQSHTMFADRRHQSEAPTAIYECVVSKAISDNKRLCVVLKNADAFDKYSHELIRTR